MLLWYGQTLGVLLLSSYQASLASKCHHTPLAKNTAFSLPPRTHNGSKQTLSTPEICPGNFSNCDVRLFSVPGSHYHWSNNYFHSRRCRCCVYCVSIAESALFRKHLQFPRLWKTEDTPNRLAISIAYSQHFKRTQTTFYTYHLMFVQSSGSPSLWSRSNVI